MRVEFFFKAQSELSSLVNFMQAYQQPLLGASKLQSQSIFNRFNLANKVKNDNLLPSAKNIIDLMPSANVCIHYSLKYNNMKSVDQSFAYFEGFLKKAEAIGVSEVMILSGSGEKKALNTVSCLEMLRKSDSITKMDISVAFNPYFPDLKNRKMEIDRLHAKLNTGMVDIIYLQFGSDINHLKEGLIELKNAISTYNKSKTIVKGREEKEVKVIGSIMIPSKVLLARMKFRPWNGVFLSETFLSDVSVAEGIVKEMLEVYREFEVEPLVETAFKTNSDAAHILALLNENVVIEEKKKEIYTEVEKVAEAGWPSLTEKKETKVVASKISESGARKSKRTYTKMEL